MSVILDPATTVSTDSDQPHFNHHIQPWMGVLAGVLLSVLTVVLFIYGYAAPGL